MPIFEKNIADIADIANFGYIADIFTKKVNDYTWRLVDTLLERWGFRICHQKLSEKSLHNVFKAFHVPESRTHMARGLV